MSFTISSEKDDDLELLQITDLSSGIQVRMLPGSGALLHEFSIPLGNRRIQIINNYRNLADLRKNHSTAYKSAKLSPFVCRISEGKYKHAQVSYEFQNKFADGTAIHGLIYDKPFTILEKKTAPDQASVIMEYQYLRDDPAYPFAYTILVEYTLKSDGRLFLFTTVKNTSTESIPIADGWHPYFNLEGQVNDWLLSFRSKKNVAFDENLIPMGHLTDQDAYYFAKRIGDARFDDCYLLESGSQEPAAVLENPDNGLQLCFFPDESYPYLQIYTPDDRQSIAIENLSSAPDSFNNGMGLIILKPGHLQSFSLIYQLKFR